MARKKKAWVPDWSVNAKALPPGLGIRVLVHAKKPQGPPPCGGKWVRATIPAILRA
jgi:hypothetical protein